MTGKAAARIGDTGTGHGCHFPPTPAISGSGDVFVNGISAVRQGDAYAPHACATCPAPPHPRALAAGSATVFINGKQAGRIGDPIDCGGSASAGSPDVFIGKVRPSVPLGPMGVPGFSVLGDAECDLEAGRND